MIRICWNILVHIFDEILLMSFLNLRNLLLSLPWQAYTVELEAELNQLREENAQLKQALVLPDNFNF